MEAIAIVAILALLQFVWISVEVGGMRGKHKILAPSTSGHPEFERMFRVQQNTLEQLVVFIPALWMFGYFVKPLWGAGLGVVFIIGRFIYRAEYLKDPGSRSPGFMITFLPTAIMLVWTLVALVRAIL